MSQNCYTPPQHSAATIHKIIGSNRLRDAVKREVDIRIMQPGETHHILSLFAKGTKDLSAGYNTITRKHYITSGDNYSPQAYEQAPPTFCDDPSMGKAYPGQAGCPSGEARETSVLGPTECTTDVPRSTFATGYEELTSCPWEHGVYIGPFCVTHLLAGMRGIQPVMAGFANSTENPGAWINNMKSEMVKKLGRQTELHARYEAIRMAGLKVVSHADGFPNIDDEASGKACFKGCPTGPLTVELVSRVKEYLGYEGIPSELKKAYNDYNMFAPVPNIEIHASGDQINSAQMRHRCNEKARVLEVSRYEDINRYQGSKMYYDIMWTPMRVPIRVACVPNADGTARIIHIPSTITVPTSSGVGFKEVPNPAFYLNEPYRHTDGKSYPVCEIALVILPGSAEMLTVPSVRLADGGYNMHNTEVVMHGGLDEKIFFHPTDRESMFLQKPLLDDQGNPVKDPETGCIILVDSEELNPHAGEAKMVRNPKGELFAYTLDQKGEFRFESPERIAAILYVCERERIPKVAPNLPVFCDKEDEEVCLDRCKTPDPRAVQPLKEPEDVKFGIPRTCDNLEPGCVLGEIQLEHTSYCVNPEDEVLQICVKRVDPLGLSNPTAGTATATLTVGEAPTELTIPQGCDEICIEYPVVYTEGGEPVAIVLASTNPEIPATITEGLIEFCPPEECDTEPCPACPPAEAEEGDSKKA